MISSSILTPACAFHPNVWTYTYKKTGDRLHAFEVDYTQVADYLQPSDLVDLHDFVERDVRARLGIPFNSAMPSLRYEHSMGQPGPLPPRILRQTAGDGHFVHAPAPAARR